MPKRRAKMYVCDLNKIILAEYGKNKKAGNGLMNELYEEAIENPLLLYNQTFLKWFVKTLEACGFKNHAKKLSKKSLSEIKGPWHIEPAGLDVLLEMWSLTKTDLARFIRAYKIKWDRLYGDVDYGSEDLRKAIFKGDAIVALLRKTHKETNWMPSRLSRCGDPAEETYRYLQNMGYEVYIPYS